MDMEARLLVLESRYRRAMSAALAAKAHYLSLRDEPSATPTTVLRAQQQWEAMEAHKRAIAARMGEVEDLEAGLVR